MKYLQKHNTRQIFKITAHLINAEVNDCLKSSATYWSDKILSIIVYLHLLFKLYYCCITNNNILDQLHAINNVEVPQNQLRADKAQLRKPADEKVIRFLVTVSRFSRRKFLLGDNPPANQKQS